MIPQETKELHKRKILEHMQKKTQFKNQLALALELQISQPNLTHYLKEMNIGFVLTLKRK